MKNHQGRGCLVAGTCERASLGVVIEVENLSSLHVGAASVDGSVVGNGLVDDDTILLGDRGAEFAG